METSDYIQIPGWQSARMVTPEQRAEIGNRVAKARQDNAWSKEGAARGAGVTSATWMKVERGEVVRDDNLARVMNYAQNAGTAAPVLEQLTDEQLIHELARRLAIRREEETSDGPAKNRPVVREVPTTGQYAVAVTTEQERRKSKRGPQRTEQTHPNGG